MQQTQLDMLGITAIRLEAATPETVSPPPDAYYWFGWRKEMSPIEKAIFCSHRTCWQLIVDEGKPYMILEDDVLLSPSIRLMLATLDSSLDLEYVQLETVSGPKLISIEPSSHVSGLRHLFRDNGGAACYWLTPVGAGKLLREAEIAPMPADEAISLNRQLYKMQAWPALSVQGENATECIRELPEYLKSSRRDRRFIRSAGPLQKLHYFRRKWLFWARTRMLRCLPPAGFAWCPVPLATDLFPFANEVMLRHRGDGAHVFAQRPTE